ncbi:MAG: hypothetical protein ACXVPQ_12000 [Bacteroidia bacterium]
MYTNPHEVSPSEFIKKLMFAVFCLVLFTGQAQQIVSFKQNGKVGFKMDDKVLIEPQYDTTLGFDVKQKVALVANLNPKKNFINPLTKEVKKVYDFYYITPENKKISVTTADKKMVSEFLIQQKIQKDYLLNTDFFKIVHDGKTYLLNKSGKQITTSGYDNIYFTKCPLFFITETRDKTGQTFLGLIDQEEKQVIPPNYSKISMNMYDSLIICCTAGTKFNGSDDVYNYKGEKLSSSARHIDYAFRQFTVFKLYEPHTSFIILENSTKKEKTIAADALFYQKDENIVMKQGEKYFSYNFKTDKKTQLDKNFTSDPNLNEQH